MSHVTVSLLGLCLLLSVSLFVVADAEKEKAATVAAGQWLTKVDQREYAESWREAAQYFKNAVTQEQWARSLRAARKLCFWMDTTKELLRNGSVGYGATAPNPPYIGVFRRALFQRARPFVLLFVGPDWVGAAFSGLPQSLCRMAKESNVGWVKPSGPAKPRR